MNIQILSAAFVSFFMLMVSAAWFIYARVTGRLYFAVMAIPFLYVAAVYWWFAVYPVDIETRQWFVRAGLTGISLVQTVVLMLILRDRGRHTKNAGK